MLPSKNVLFFSLSAFALAGIVHVASIHSRAQENGTSPPPIGAAGRDNGSPPNTLEADSVTTGIVAEDNSSGSSGTALDVAFPAGSAGGLSAGPPTGAGSTLPGRSGGRPPLRQQPGFPAAGGGSLRSDVGPTGSMGMSSMMMPGMGTGGIAAPESLIANFEQQAQALIAAYSDLPDDQEAEKAGIAQQLSEVISQQFDLRQQMRENELTALEEQVRRLRELHNKRTTQKDKIVKDRVEQLLRDADGLGWGNDNANLLQAPKPGMSGMMGPSMGMPGMMGPPTGMPGMGSGSGGTAVKKRSAPKGGGRSSDTGPVFEKRARDEGMEKRAPSDRK
jgi:hypothetical protein